MHLSTISLSLITLGTFAQARILQARGGIKQSTNTPLARLDHRGLAAGLFSLSGITVFGDSLSDDGAGPGSTWQFTNHVLPNDPNYYNMTNRRWSNDPVWTERFAQRLGVPLTDYAVGGATTNNDLIKGVLGDFIVPGAVQQYQQYVGASDARPPANELFVVLAGANDALLSAQNNLNPAATHTDETQLATSGMAAIKTIVEGLIQSGARNFFLGLYPDVSRAPITSELAQFPAFKTDIKTYLTALNSLTREYFHELQARTNPSLHVTLGDFYDLFNPILDNPHFFGFSNGSAVGCVVGTYGADGYSICSTEEKVQNTYLFWDHIHPTSNGHQIIADDAYASLVATHLV
ncbi:hypothetical protein FRB96_008328 [Tulasnella sp. 330]|nr:hypothetical protein FRB96_008328 [Tulasnella sp. 330]KAG8889891.1 hypothetical protein FRB98_002245 [Tulasnella sp. 332]